jgi:FtsP/CotA-like multicopper oxidase with cupredoxin domain
LQSTREAFVLHHWDTGKNKADNLLINGRGRFPAIGGDKVNTPTEVFEIALGLRYRFRVVSPGFTLCPVVVSVEGHNLTMIASDGAPFKPIEAASFIVHPGERQDLDFVFSCNIASDHGRAYHMTVSFPELSGSILC